MAVKLRAPGGAHDLVTVTSPAFLVRDGAAFVELLLARAPTPRPARPTRRGWAHSSRPTPRRSPRSRPCSPRRSRPATRRSRTTASTRSSWWTTPAHARRCDSRGHRSRASPMLDDASDRDPDFLADELADRLASGPAAFDLVVHLGTDDDPTDDPTAVWPERPTVVAGRLELDGDRPGRGTDHLRPDQRARRRRAPARRRDPGAAPPRVRPQLRAAHELSRLNRPGSAWRRR